MKKYEQINIDKYKAVSFTVLKSKESETVRMWRNHPVINKWMCGSHVITAKEHKKYIASLKENKNKYYWLIKDNENAYGVISLIRIDTSNKNAYLGIYVNPIHKVKSSGSVLMKCLKDIVFKKMKLHTLKLEVITTNTHAIKFYKKNGFKKEGILKEFVYKNRKWTDVIVMGIKR